MASRRRVTRIRNSLLMIALISVTYIIYSKVDSILNNLRSNTQITPAKVRTEAKTFDRCQRKNVLMLISDDLRPQLGSYLGEDFPTPLNPPKMFTPHLDKLASKSLLLKRAYAQISSCGPSRTSFLTSRRPDTTKVWDLKTYWRRSAGNFTTLPQYFKENGYLTAGVGKVFHPEKSSNFDDLISWTEPYYHPPNMPYWSYVFTVGLSWKAVSKQEQRKMPLEDQQTANEAIKLLRKFAAKGNSCDQPFFLATGFHKPHLPFVFPEEFLEYYPSREMDIPHNYYAPYKMPEIAWQDFPELRRFPDLKKLRHSGAINETFSTKVTKDLRRAYYASVSYVDSLVGDVLAEVERLGLSNSTVVSFIGDHGFHLGENGQWVKHSNFEQGLHTPMMVHIPKKTDHGVSSRSLAELVDVFPTLVEAAGLPKIPACEDNSTGTLLCTEGDSLLPLIEDPQLEIKEVAISQHRRMGLKMGYTIRTDRWRYTEWVRYDRSLNANQNWDYQVVWNDPIGVELYDHDRDPEENVNLAGRSHFKGIVDKLKTKLHVYCRSKIYDVRRGQLPVGLVEDPS